MYMVDGVRIAILVCANTEWIVLRGYLPSVQMQESPFGEWFLFDLNVNGCIEKVLFFHTGWGKIAASSATQYLIDRWSPKLLINLGTCGGFEGEVETGTVILADRAIVYDIMELMGDTKQAIEYYSTDIDTSWLSDEVFQGVKVRRTLLVSGDRSLLPEDIPNLKAYYGAVAGDWESGAIAWVAKRNDTNCLILRGVSDLVGVGGGEAYGGTRQVYQEGAERILNQLVQLLPRVIAQAVSALRA